MAHTTEIYSATDFIYNAITTSGPNAAGAGTIVLRYQGNGAVSSTSQGFPILINTSTPLLVGGDSNSEVVTPTAVSIDQFGNINVTATFANAHGVGEPVTSASYGLQEAASYAFSKGGGLIALTPLWFGLAGGHTAGLTFLHTLKGYATVTVLDFSGNSNTTTPATSYYAAPITAPVTGGVWTASAVAIY